jgi:small subunit ribosomal protein S5
MAEENNSEPKKDEPRNEKDAPKLREERIKQQQQEYLDNWKPKTKLGKLVKDKKIKTIEEALKYKILEPEIVDLLVDVKSEILNIGQAKGKFGGGKRRAWRQTQKKTAEGNIPTFSCMVVVGNEDGYVGLGYGKAKETLPARSKALRKAKLNIMKINRGCASFDCVCGEPHTVPFIVEGKCGSCRVKLIPAPQGTGLVIGDECKKILKVAGIKDVYSVSRGKIRTTINLTKACLNALEKTMRE